MRRCCHAQNGHKMAEKRLSGGKISGCGHASVLPRENGAMSAGREPQRRGCHARTGPCRLGGSPCVGAATRKRGPSVGAAKRKRGHVGWAGAPASGLPRENGAMSAEREPRHRGCHPKKFELFGKNFKSEKNLKYEKNLKFEKKLKFEKNLEFEKNLKFEKNLNFEKKFEI